MEYYKRDKVEAARFLRLEPQNWYNAAFTVF